MPLAFDKGSSVLGLDLCGSGAPAVKKAMGHVGAQVARHAGLVRGRARF
jgi:hypothetical protein